MVYVWGTAARRLVVGDRVAVETYVKKTRSDQDLFVTREAL